MRSRFQFPPIDFFRPLMPQLVTRAHWVGWGLQEHESEKGGHRWALVRVHEKGKPAEVRVFHTLCEIDIALNALLDELSDRLCARLPQQNPPIKHEWRQGGG